MLVITDHLLTHRDTPGTLVVHPPLRGTWDLCGGGGEGEKKSRVFSALFGPFHSSSGITSGRGTHKEFSAPIHQGHTRDTPGIHQGYTRDTPGVSVYRCIPGVSMEANTVLALPTWQHCP